jgi:rhodanese-related sulfurtransferase
MAPFTFTSGVSMIVALLIGFAFGFVLERAGFGDARRLVAQFYLYNMRVLKVMFTAIVTAMVLIFLSSAVGLVDFQRLFVPPTYLWPGIIGGFLIGAGFILGGYCPGTAVVAMATFKIDALLFVFGVTIGSVVFAEIAPLIWNFYQTSGFMGRVTIGEWLGVDQGIVVLGVIFMAIGAFALAEWAEAQFRAPAEKKAEPETDSSEGPVRRQLTFRPVTVSIFVILGVLIALVGQPTLETRIERNEKQLEEDLASRQYHIDPAELLNLMHNNQLRLQIIDVRPEAEYNLFHLRDAHNLRVEQVSPEWLQGLAPGTVTVIVSNGEEKANEAWKRLAVRPPINSYILAGGINRWLDLLADDKADVPGPDTPVADDQAFRHAIEKPLGGQHPESWPSIGALAERPYVEKVKVAKPKRPVGGGCG